MAQSKDARFLRGEARGCHGSWPERGRTIRKDHKKIVLICVLAALLVLPGIFIPEVQAQEGLGTILLGARVDPPSGRAGFQLTVDYAYLKNTVGSMDAISCFYRRPDGTWVPIKEITPSAEFEGLMMTDDPFIKDQAIVTFTVAPTDGTLQEGEYTVRCVSGQLYSIQTAFSVVPEKTAEPTAESEPAVTDAPTRVYHLDVKMSSDTYEAVMTAKWDGNLTVNPDSSVRTKLLGFLAVDSPIRANGVTVANVHYDIFFMIDVAGTAEVTPAGITMRLMQTFAFFRVLKPALSFVEGASQSDIAEAQDYFQKAMEGAVPSLLDQILRGLEFENVSLPATQDVSVGIWKGTAVLSPEKKWAPPSQ